MDVRVGGVRRVLSVTTLIEWFRSRNSRIGDQFDVVWI